MRVVVVEVRKAADSRRISMPDWSADLPGIFHHAKTSRGIRLRTQVLTLGMYGWHITLTVLGALPINLSNDISILYGDRAYSFPCLHSDSW